jgi:septal ring factor EnvC (AmiA/AmiB activator)
MKTTVMEAHAVRLGVAVLSVLVTGSTVTGIGALAQSMSVSGPPMQDGADDLKRLQSLIEQQSRRLDEQDRRLEEQEKTIKSLREKIDAHGVSGAAAGAQLDKAPLEAAVSRSGRWRTRPRQGSRRGLPKMIHWRFGRSPLH